MRLKLRVKDEWALLKWFKAGREHRPKSAGAELGPEWLKGWRAAQALKKASTRPQPAKGRR